MKDCTLHELETVVARLAHVERSNQGHYPFHNWQLLRRFLYNHAGFERDESVDPTGLSLLTADPAITPTLQHLARVRYGRAGHIGVVS